MTDTTNTASEPVAYSLSFAGSFSYSTTVTATTVEEAIDQAHEDMPADVCAQCSGWGQNWSRDFGDELEFTEAIRDGEIVQSGETYANQLMDELHEKRAEVAALRGELVAAKARVAQLEGR